MTDAPVVILGAGLAGLFTALRLAPLPVTVLSPVALGDGAASTWAQGGVAAALVAPDSPEQHAADTVAAGAGLVDPDVALGVAVEAAARIEDLAALGTPFDRLAGAFVQSREAAHSRARVVRVRGDRAGAAIMAAVVAAARAAPSITLREGWSAEALAAPDGAVRGVWARGPGGLAFLPARAVVLATGGIGGLYAVSSNPGALRGEGLGLAALAGAAIRDPEFVQFHPTGLAVAADPSPLASEALRGEGATLIDAAGRRFMVGLHPDAELAPRDIVARAIHARVAAGEAVFLDTRAALGARVETLFPTLWAAAQAAGIDPRTQPIPIRPVQHYHMGGVATDARGRSTLPGLWAVGEVAATGLHGANRLASNSLLEAVVFGARAAADIADTRAPSDAACGPAPRPGPGPAAPAVARLRRVMTDRVGVVRHADGLRAALADLAALAALPGGAAWRNMTTAATLVAAAALARTESRGAHARADHPQTVPALGVSTLFAWPEAEALRRQHALAPV